MECHHQYSILPNSYWGNLTQPCTDHKSKRIISLFIIRVKVQMFSVYSILKGKMQLGLEINFKETDSVKSGSGSFAHA